MGADFIRECGSFFAAEAAPHGDCWIGQLKSLAGTRKRNALAMLDFFAVLRY